MGEFYYKKEWLPILAEQEEMLRFEKFSREDALAIGLGIIRLAQEKYNGNVSIRIIEDDVVVLSYKMNGTNLDNDGWIFRKTNVSKAAGVSSLRAYTEIECGLRHTSWQGRESAYTACGGCFPVLMREGAPFAYIAVSGLEHYLDHQVVADAIAAHLGITAGSVL